MRIIVGLSSGIGNIVYMLPAMKALFDMKHELFGFVDDNYTTASLWKRCRYFTFVSDSMSDLPLGDLYVCGHWIPPSWKTLQGEKTNFKFAHYRYEYKPDYTTPEMYNNMRIAQDLGWEEFAPDISDWFMWKQGAKPAKKYHIGFIPGGTTRGPWERRRYPRMAELAKKQIESGRRVAVFGRYSDGVRGIPGEYIQTPDIADLPEALNKCQLIVGTETGPAYLAHALGIPTIMLFTATNPVKGFMPKPMEAVITPECVDCSPCYQKPEWGSCKNWVCQNLPHESIETAVSRFFNGSLKGE